MNILLKIFVKLLRSVLRGLYLVLPPKICYRLRLRILYESDILLTSIEKSESMSLPLKRGSLLYVLLPISWLKILSQTARYVTLGSLWRNSQIRVTFRYIRQVKNIQKEIDNLMLGSPDDSYRATLMLSTPIHVLLGSYYCVPSGTLLNHK